LCSGMVGKVGTPTTDDAAPYDCGAGAANRCGRRTAGTTAGCGW
jgi:hypothetical protein